MRAARALVLIRSQVLVCGYVDQDPVAIGHLMLAERAGLSVQGLSALENGRRQAPYRHTITLLARALGLTVPESVALEAVVVRGRIPAGGTHLAAAAAPSMPVCAGGVVTTILPLIAPYHVYSQYAAFGLPPCPVRRSPSAPD